MEEGRKGGGGREGGRKERKKEITVGEEKRTVYVGDQTVSHTTVRPSPVLSRRSTQGNTARKFLDAKTLCSYNP